MVLIIFLLKTSGKEKQYVGNLKSHFDTKVKMRNCSYFQVLRYRKGGEPLWIAKTPKPVKVPECLCGAKRQFEFQVWF